MNTPKESGSFSLMAKDEVNWWRSGYNVTEDSMDSTGFHQVPGGGADTGRDSTWHPGGGILDRWSSRNWDNGLQIESLDELDSFAVRTRNSIYEITVLSRLTGEVMVRGGRFFPERTVTRLAGSSLGGSFLKMGGVYPGFSLEFQDGARRIITSPVQSVALT